MRFSRFLARRLVWAVAVVWAVLTVAWLLITFMPDPNKPLLSFACTRGGNSYEECQAMLAAYDQRRGFAGPLLARYVDWIADFATFDWGRSFAFGKPVTAVFVDRAPLTLVYLVPAVVVSVVGGVSLGTLASVRPGSIADRIVSAFSYLGAAFPIFWLGEFALFFIFQQFGWIDVYFEDRGLWTATNLLRLLVVPGLIVTVNLLAVQLRYARTETRGYVTEEFVKVVRAKGGGRVRVAIHVFRNAWIPLFALFFTELIGALFLSAVVVEVVFRLPGIANAMYRGFLDRDPGLVLAAMLLAVVVGVVGRLLQDIAAYVSDPRIRDDATAARD